MNNFRFGKSKDNLDASLVEDIKQMVDKDNEYVKKFRQVRDLLAEKPDTEVTQRLYRGRKNDPRLYNLPSSDEVAALIIGDFEANDLGRDVVVRKQSGQLMRLLENHSAFIPLQYPLMFPSGERGYSDDIYMHETEKEARTRNKVTFRKWVAFRIQERNEEFGNIVNARKLYQQFLVDTFSMIECQRLTYIKNNQSTIRQDFLSGIQESIQRGDCQPSSAGKRVVLPASFVGGMRYMFNNSQDAMSICKRFGYPDLFITFTCNSNWPEIVRFVEPRHIRPDEKPDISCRLFKMKVDDMMSDFKKGDPFGELDAGMYTIEFQKRGLPHAHILLWLKGENKINTINQIDQLICAEFPDPQLFPKLHGTVSRFMMHGPCGISNKSNPCMKDGKCSKFFPKNFQDQTLIDEDGYPSYKRRNLGITVTKKGELLDSRNVVPYNPILLMRYQAHINVESCNKSNAIKYLFKYVNKGSDRAALQVSHSRQHNEDSTVVDEIKQYYDCRYLSSYEAAWRIYAWDINQRWPPVQRLTFHLEGKQPLYWKDYEKIDNVVNRTKDKLTMFLAWMEANKEFPEARELTYAQFPEKFVFIKDQCRWKPRKQVLPLVGFNSSLLE